MHHDTFNADFYVTAATVIPVLYLALTLQGSTFEKVMSKWRDSVQDESKDVRPIQVFLPAYVLFCILASVIILGGLLGEFYAIMALYSRSAADHSTVVVAVSLLALLAAVVAGPTISYWSIPWKFISAIKRHVAEPKLDSEQSHEIVAEHTNS
jgi:hypothetical protein